MNLKYQRGPVRTWREAGFNREHRHFYAIDLSYGAIFVWEFKSDRDAWVTKNLRHREEGAAHAVALPANDYRVRVALACNQIQDGYDK